MREALLNEILALLDEKKIGYKHLKHEHVHTSEDAAKVRGNSVQQALKAIVLKVKGYKDDFVLCCLPGDKRIDFSKLKKELGLKDCCLASPKEVLEVTGCKVGTVPPLGSILGLETFMDESVLDNEIIYFSSATHHDSIKILVSEYVRFEKPKIMSFVN